MRNEDIEPGFQIKESQISKGMAEKHQTRTEGVQRVRSMDYVLGMPQQIALKSVMDHNIGGREARKTRKSNGEEKWTKI